MSAGVARNSCPAASFDPIRHEQPEIYFILEGTGIMRIDGHETVVKAGTAVFIPGNAEHGIRNDSDANLKLFYAFPTGSFADVVYRFPDN